MTKRIFQSGWVSVAALGFTGLSLTAISSQNPVVVPEPTPEQATFFETKIRPVLATKCTDCHGKNAQLGGLRLDSRAALLKGGATGPSLVPGDPDASLLIRAVRHSGKLKMPQGGKLAANEIADLEAWVKMGAPWPSKSAVSTPTKAPLWSLQPVIKPKPPVTQKPGWVLNPIDAFVLAKLEAKKLAPAPTADRRTLIRRVTYDLTGLPPTYAEVEAFVKDKSPGAYERVVERLLASPRYGERWARQWLDVARYADTKGYVFEEDRNYPNAYTYRRWVIDALNRDLPYDQFVTQQIAADRLPTVQTGDDKTPLAALGFLTVGRRFLNSVPDIMDDRIDVTMRGFQGLTVACARCHDHKFDPIPTQDYYSLYAVFNSSVESTEPISEPAIRSPWQINFQRQQTTEMGIRDLQLKQIQRLRDPNVTASAEVRQLLQSVREGDIPRGDNLPKVEGSFTPAAREELTKLRATLADLKANEPRKPEFAMAMSDSPNPSDGVVFKRGNPGNPGDPAPRRFLAALNPPGKERPHWSKTSGRLELAQSIVSRDNPLTARVFVNRVWLGHFGAGIVRTPSDFGRQGEPPTDPKLLDYLASTFMESGWSIKRLHRLMVTSATYRQSCAVDAAKFTADPDNRLWGRMNRRRLDLEQMRDSVMLASGKLETAELGGRSVDLWAAPYSGKRAVYGFIERQNLPGIFRTFDFASPDSTSAQRFRTTVPQQALFFMNSPFSVEQARSIVSLPEIAGTTDGSQRVRRLYQRLYGRLPDADELAAGVAYLKTDRELAAPGQAWKYGYGDAANFTPLMTYADNLYRVGSAYPDPKLGYIQLNASGGHPGRDGQHAVVRRWTAPAAMTIQISGKLTHPAEPGDGVRARVVVRGKTVGEWAAHHQEIGTNLALVPVAAGDTVDFIVDPRTGDNSDAFAWPVQIKGTDGRMLADSSANFAAPGPMPVTRFVLYAQALMMANEFMFVD
jgi:cytochrome c553